MEDFAYGVFSKREGYLGFSSDLEDMKELCDRCRASDYPNAVVKTRSTDVIVYPLKKYCVWIWNRSTNESKPITIEQGDRTNIASSPQIPKGWSFMNATPEDGIDV